MKLNLLRIVGARPQFMQAKPLSQEFKKRGHKEILLHTGQHYDDIMSQQFFRELNLDKADINLNVGSGYHGEQTALMLQGIEKHLLDHKYDAVVVDGDTNSTLAGALAASKLHIPVVHVEAGMRSFDKKMPEEINRILTDHVSKLLFCPSAVSKNNLAKESITKGVHISGDLLAQCFYEFRDQALTKAEKKLQEYGLKKEEYILLTLHRAENVDNPKILQDYLRAIATSPWPVVFPVHPRTYKNIVEFNLEDIIQKKPFKLISPIGYLDMLALESSALKILTDSGGVQREAYHWQKQGVILRDTTEWTEIIHSKWASFYLPGDDPSKLWQISDTSILSEQKFYGLTDVAQKIVEIMEKTLL
jgi:UDP-GlcNAc3NAcA epimerase